mgnify:CR=1 FL=1
MTDIVISAILTIFILANIMNLGGLLLWVERKGSAVLQDRIGANRAAILGKLPLNIGIINTLVADPIKLFTKEDFVPPNADKFLHWLAPALAMGDRRCFHHDSWRSLGMFAEDSTRWIGSKSSHHGADHRYELVPQWFHRRRLAAKNHR